MNRLDDEKLRGRCDEQGMIGVIDRFGAQCKEAIERGAQLDRGELPTGKRIDEVVVCGMGGSAMAGDIAKRFAKFPLFINRSYTLPAFVDQHTLLIAISYSGNTAETLSALDAGIAAGAVPLIIASGGELEVRSKAEEIPFLKIPAGYQPRAALGHLALPLLLTLARLGLLKEIEPWKTLHQGLDRVRERCTVSIPTERNPAKQLALALNGRIPIVYGTVDNTCLIAMRWKTQINENAKQPAFWNAFPELNHNEILALVRADLLSDQHVLLLENDYDLPENRGRIEIMTELFAEHKVLFTRVRAEGASELAQILAQIHLGDYVSYYLALLNGVDPTPVELIEGFKQALAARRSEEG